MINENEFKAKISKNLIYYRKMNKLTQGELAKKLNYSDKAISKWERGENLPDLYILMMIADLYGITLNDLVSDNPSMPKVIKTKIHSLVTYLSIGMVWLIATIVYILMIIINPEIHKAWLAFIYAIPVSFILLIIFSCLWWNNTLVTIAVSLLSWSIPLSICLTWSFKRLWFLFVCIVPFQVLILLWSRLSINIKKIIKVKTKYIENKESN